MLFSEISSGKTYKVIKGNDTLFAGDYIILNDDGSLTCQATEENWSQKCGFFTKSEDIERVVKGATFELVKS